jgi:integrase/recombinase XerC
MTSVLEPPRVEFDPLRDKSYQATRRGRSVVDFLAWKKLGGAADSTLEGYERDLARGCLMYPNKTLAQITDADMLQIALAFKPAGRKTRMAAYQSMYRWALKSRLVRVNPCDALPDFKPRPKKVYDIFSDAEITALTSLPVRDGALLQFMFDTGARKGDCINFRFRYWRTDTDRETAPYGMVVFLDGKGGKDRQVPATLELAQKLTELEMTDGLGASDYLWYSRPGGGKVRRSIPLGKSAFQDWWERCLDNAGVRPDPERDRNAHLTRHTFATRYLRRGGRLETLRKVLGHEQISTTEGEYVHLDMRDVALDFALVATRAGVSE